MRRRVLGKKTNDDGYEFVDMGLSVKWATCNIGANSPEEYGWYFMYGDTTPYDKDRKTVPDGEELGVWGWSKYPLCNGSSSTIIKYCTQSSYGTVDNKTVLELEDDAAHVHLGDDWRMPTETEFQELINACNITWISSWKGTGVNGRLFTLKSDSSKTLFFPAAGYLDWLSYNQENFRGVYKTSSLSSSDSGYSRHLDFYQSMCEMADKIRYHGHSIRAVKPNK